MDMKRSRFMSSEIDRVLANPEHMIMSADLENEFHADPSTVSPLLNLDGASYVCTLVSATLLKPETRRWEFLLEVPGIQFEDIITLPNIQFEYGDSLFGEVEDLKIEMKNLEARYVLLSLREIIKEETEENV